MSGPEIAEQKVGLSLSLCISDVIAGRVSEEEIHGIVAGTAVETPEDIDAMVATYRQTYWRQDPNTGEAVTRRLFEEDKVYQPRLEGKPAPKPVPLRWLKVVEDWQNSYPTHLRPE